MPLTSDLGGKLGPRLASLMSQAVIATRQRLAPHEVNTSMALQERFFRLVASEAGMTVSHLTRQLANDPDAPPWLASTFRFMANASGQWAGMLNFAVYGSGLSQGLSGLLANAMAPMVQRAFSADPNAVISPPGAADFVARRIWGFGDGNAEAHRSAISTRRFQALVDASERLPEVGQLVDWRRRGLINPAKLASYMARIGYRGESINHTEAALPELIPVPDLASMVDRGEMSQAEAESRAHQWGYRAGDFRHLVNIVGVPPATELLLAGYRRGLISRERLARGIRQSPLRSEWIDFITQLQFDPMTTDEAVAAASQNFLSKSAARKIARMNGLRDEDFDTLLNTAGRPPGEEMLLELWNRGEATEAEVRQALLESPLKNKWVPLIMRTRRRIPPQEQVRQFVKAGVITPRAGIEKLMNLGYSRDDSEAFVKLAQADKTETDRELTKTEILSLYEFRAINRDRTESLLKDLGYDQGEANWLISIGELRRAKRQADAASAVVRSKFVAHKITDVEASSLLDQLGVPADMRDHAIELWRLEREANQAELTQAQVVRAWKRGVIDDSEATGRLLRLGYDQREAQILMASA